MTWRSVELVGPEEVFHVTPVGDLIEHDLTPHCICGPRIILMTNAEGRSGRIVTHASLDGREGQEQTGLH